jgi:hypothetical protein
MFSAKVRQRSIGTNGYVWLLAILLIPVAAFFLGTGVPNSWADDDVDDEEIPFDEAMLFFELNDTDGDLGIHAKIDGDAWKELEIEDPRGREILDIRVKGRLRRQGLTEIAFESAEPPFESDDPDEETLPPWKFFRRFPEGEYEIEGETLDGEELENEVYVSHVMPAPPDGIMLSTDSGVFKAAEDCDDEPLPVVSGDVTISWAPVTESHPEIGKAGDVEVVKYEVVVEREEPTLLIFSVELPPDVTEVTVPEAFIELADEFKFEILVQTTTGNRTAVESCFETE